MPDSVTITLDLPAMHRFLNVLSACIAEMLNRAADLPADAPQVYELQLAAQEVCTNIVNHAYAPDAAHQRIVVHLSCAERLFSMVFEDSGVPYESKGEALLPDPEDSHKGGMGLFLIGHLVDNVTYERRDDRNIWRLTKHLA